MTQPDILHTRLVAEIERQLAVARAAENSCYHIDDCDGAISEFLAVDGPAASARRLEGELEVLERHEPVYEIPKTDGGTRWVCRSRCKVETCVELRSLAHRLGVSVDA